MDQAFDKKNQNNNEEQNNITNAMKKTTSPALFIDRENGDLFDDPEEAEKVVTTQAQQGNKHI